MLKLSNASPESQAHCLVAQAITQPKPVKELVLPPHGKITNDKARNANTVSKIIAVKYVIEMLYFN